MSVIAVTYSLTALVEALMFFLTFDTFFDKRKPFAPWNYTVGVIVLALLIGLVNAQLLYRVSNAFGMIAAAIVVSLPFYRTVWRKRLLVPLFVWLLMAALEMLVLQMECIVFHVDALELLENPAYFVLGVVVSKVLALAVCVAMRARHQANQFALGSTYWLLFIALFASAVLAAFLMFYMLGELGSPTYSVMALVASICLYASVFLALYLYERSAKQYQIIRLQEQSEQQMRQQLKHMDEIIFKQNELRKIRHDMNNHFIALYRYFDTGENAKGKRYIEGLIDQFDRAAPAINTGNNALDAILSAKKSLAESKGIAFQSELRIRQALPIDPQDLCILLGNALDNAIEACDSLPEAAEKSITLTLRQDANSLFCELINTAPQQLNDNFATSKADKQNHGFGLKNICETLEKYQSEPEIAQNDGQFSLSFVIFFQSSDDEPQI